MMDDQLNHRGGPLRGRGGLSLISSLRLALVITLSGAPCHLAMCAPSSAQAKSGQAKPAQKTAGAKTKVDRSHWKSGVIEIKSDIERGQVEIGGKRVSAYPMPGPWTLSPGRYTITLREESWSQTRVVEVSAGDAKPVKIYRDPANDPDAQTIPKDFQIISDEPDIELYHPGAGFNLSTAGYVLMGLSVASLGYGVYEQVASNDAKLDAENLGDEKAAEKKTAMDSAMAGAWRSRIALGFGAVTLLSGVAFSMFGSGGWLDSVKVKPKTGPVFGPDASRRTRPEAPRWGFTVSDERSSVWAHWRW